MAGFDRAIQNIKAGHKVTREEWCGRAHLKLVDSEEIPETKCINIVANEAKEGEEPEVDVWLPDSEDLLAEDWSVLA